MRVFYPVFNTLGILVCARDGQSPFAEGRYLRKLSLAGKQKKLRVLVFDPQSWNPDDDTVEGWIWQEEADDWKAVQDRVPSLAYDRSWPHNPEVSAAFRQSVHRLRQAGKIRLLNAVLPDKWHTHLLLSKTAGMEGLLPPTARYDGPDSLREWLAQHDGAAFLKPVVGSQGRRVAVCTMASEGAIRIRGRQSDNRPFDLTLASESAAMIRLQRWIGERDYLMQTLLDLTGRGRSPYDIRALAQKNGRGRWTMTGLAARIGPSGAVTANLHGGGTAAPADEWLTGLHGKDQADKLIEQIRNASRLIVHHLECNCGHFCELGLDFGVDTTGKLWFLEANAKPGRSAMAEISAAVADASVARPIACAKFILRRPSGRVFHEFDHL